MKIVCLDGFFLEESNPLWNKIKELGDFTYYEGTPKDKVIERSKDADILIINKIVFTKKIIDQLPKLKFVTILATGYNIIDLEYAKSKGILVSNAPSYSTNSVAQHTFALILDIFNNVRLHAESTKKGGEWINHKFFSYWLSPIIDLKDKYLGIIGYGEIGREVAKIGNAFGMKVLSVKRGRSYETTPYVEFLPLDELIKKSDIISLHCPANEETIGMVNKDFLSKMKKDAILLNLARGVLVNEQDVCDALNKEQIAHFATDVVCEEPIKASCPLLNAKNITITPHMAWASVNARKRLLEINTENIIAYLKGKPINVVN